MHQQLPVMTLVTSFLLLNAPVVPTDFRIFGNSPNEFLLTDDTPSNHLVGRVQAPVENTDTFPSSGSITNRHQWRFQIFRPHKEPDQLFRIDPESGELYTIRLIDREALCPQFDEADCVLDFQVAAQPQTTQGLPSFIDVKVLLVDRNDHVPEFPDPGFVNFTVPESAVIGTKFPLPLARDPDTSQYSVSAYTAEPGLPPEWSLVVETSGSGEEMSMRPKMGSSTNKITGLYLKLQKPLDHEKRKNYTFKIRALDGLEANEITPTGNRKDILHVFIYVEDINDNGPVFRPREKSYSGVPTNVQLSDWMVTYTATVPESKWIKDPILKLEADDLDGPANSKIHYYFAPATSKQVREYFKLDSVSGYLFLRKPLDYELQTEFSFRVTATDVKEESLRGNPTQSQPVQSPSTLHTATAQVVITVIDTNDETPAIEVDFISNGPSKSPLMTKYAEVEENAPPPQFIASIQATDRDAGLSGQVNCIQQPVVNPSSIKAGLWSKPTAAENSSQFQLDEIRQEIGRVQYRLLTREALDREDTENGGAYRQVKIICTDAGQPPRTSSTFVNIRVRDENDNAPKIILRQPPDYLYGLESSETDMWPFVFENAPVGSLVTRVNASDLDEGENGRLSYSIEKTEQPDDTVNPFNFFQINEKTGDITTRIEIDREAFEPPLSCVTLKVKVSDNGVPPKSATQEIKIYIRDENDNGPVFQRQEYQFHVMENLPAGYAVGEILVTDKDEGEIKLGFGMQPHGPLPFTIWQSPSGADNEHKPYSMTLFILNTTRPLDREAEHAFRFTLLATDGPSGYGRSRIGTATATATVEVFVENENDNDPVIIFPQKQNKTFYLSCHEKKNFELLTINANDKDPSENPHIFELVKSAIEARMINQSSTSNFTKEEGEAGSFRVSDFLDIEPTTGIVFLSRDMKSEDKGVHIFKVQVTDGGVPPRSSSITFFVLVDNSSPRSPLRENPAPAINPSTRPAANTDRPPPKDSTHILSDRTSSRKRSHDIRPRQGQRVASDLIILLALGLVFLLLIATLGLVVYFRYWKKQTRLAQVNGNRDSLLFANHVNMSGSTCMKEIRVPASKKPERWLCTSDGSIIGVSSPPQLLTESEHLKNHFPTVISSSDSTGNIYYKAKADTLRPGGEGNDNGTAYSSLVPMTSVILKPNLVPGCESYLRSEPQLAYYAQNMHALGPQPKDRSVTSSSKNTLEKNIFRNVSAMKQQQNEILVLPPIAWDCQSRSDTSSKQEDLVTDGRREDANVGQFYSPFS
ncbi:unnamed protein product [Mesocestoides corti]|uniref:Cadherin-1 n=1 Tax=Mesocestoides corti TaxID=53468 RepID=A0A0R3UIX6_MESCO|nr:unnamed protein product [Mesocestoides corti]